MARYGEAMGLSKHSMAALRIRDTLFVLSNVATPKKAAVNLYSVHNRVIHFLRQETITAWTNCLSDYELPQRGWEPIEHTILGDKMIKNIKEQDNKVQDFPLPLLNMENLQEMD